MLCVFATQDTYNRHHDSHFTPLPLELVSLNLRHATQPTRIPRHVVRRSRRLCQVRTAYVHT